MSALLILAALVAGPADAANTYRQPETWLCRPGHSDLCGSDLAATVVTPDGVMRVEPARRAATPKADCFYLYPTTSMDPAPHSDMIAGDAERGMVVSQAAPLRSACCVFAPLYRQVTLPALRLAMSKGTKLTAADFALPYADVLAAWRDYLVHDNHGRPFVLVGHSQGSAMLKQLLVDEIDGKPIARQMLSAILPGTSIMVPRGKDVGGDLKATPLCRAAAQTECVVTWATYRYTNPPPVIGLFGRAVTIGATASDDLVAGCTNPARLEGGPAPLDPLLGFPWWKGGVATFQQPKVWTASGKPVTTRFVKMPGLLSGECVVRRGFTYLAVKVAPGAATDLIAATIGPVAVGDAAWPDWGFHVVDMAVVEGDLATLIYRQSVAWARRSRTR
ncbi:DUF3089 domain-containing protein [Sphingomonas sp. UYP23]